MYIEHLMINEQGNFMTPRELENEGSRIIVEKMLDDYKGIEPSDVIHMMVHSSIVLEGDHDHNLKGDIINWVNDNEVLIKEMFSGFSELREDMEKVFSGFCHDLDKNHDILNTISTYYTTLWGLWLAGEKDPTNGLAWDYLSYATEQIDPKNFGLIKDYIRSTLYNRMSANPIQELWKKILAWG